jgi:hypothetical protein
LGPRFGPFALPWADQDGGDATAFLGQLDRSPPLLEPTATFGDWLATAKPAPKAGEALVGSVSGPFHFDWPLLVKHASTTSKKANAYQ